LIYFNYDDYIDDEKDLVAFSLFSFSYYSLLLSIFVYTLLLAGLILPENLRVSVKVSLPPSFSANFYLSSLLLLAKIDVFTNF